MTRYPEKSSKPPSQAEIIDFLSNGAAYSPAAPTVSRRQTHCSIIFLAGAFAYKLKREVRYAFLDFSTLDRRLKAARNELSVNRRYAAELYLGLAAVVVSPDGKLHLMDEEKWRRGEGERFEAVEWLVKMRRFGQEALYSHRAKAGLIDDSDARELARMASKLHASSPPVKASRQAYQAFIRVHEENLDFFRQNPHLLAREQSERVLANCGALLEKHRGLIEQRAQLGFYRHCHGDLHLDNIILADSILADRGPMAFDAIEFDDAIAATDIYHDLAFLLMDLWRSGLHRQANILLNAYLIDADQTDLRGLALLPLFIAFRALVRLKVLALKAKLQDEGENSKTVEGVQAYARLAESCLQRERPHLLAIGGLSGSGKSTVARNVAASIGAIPGALVLRSDVERKRMFNVAETEALPPEAYGQDITRKVYEHLWRKAGWALGAGHSVIVDAVQAMAHERARVEEIAASYEAGFTGVWLRAPADTLRQRVKARVNDASDADENVVRRQLDYDIGAMGWPEVDSSAGPQATSRMVLRLLSLAGLADK